MTREETQFPGVLILIAPLRTDVMIFMRSRAGPHENHDVSGVAVELTRFGKHLPRGEPVVAFNHVPVK